MKGIFFIASFFLLLETGLFSAFAQNATMNWKAGVAKIDITPKQIMWIAGFASRTQPAEGKLHSLWAKALFLEDSRGETVLLVTSDLLGFPKEISDHIRNEVNKKMGLQKSQIILNSSHTHSGPVLSGSPTHIYPLDQDHEVLIKEYSDWLANQIVKIAIKARDAMEPVKLYSRNGVVRFQVNRRNNKESQLKYHQDLKGPNDFSVPVLKIENKKGK